MAALRSTPRPGRGFPSAARCGDGSTAPRGGDSRLGECGLGIADADRVARRDVGAVLVEQQRGAADAVSQSITAGSGSISSSISSSASSASCGVVATTTAIGSPTKRTLSRAIGRCRKRSTPSIGASRRGISGSDAIIRREGGDDARHRPRRGEIDLTMRPCATGLRSTARWTMPSRHRRRRWPRRAAAASSSRSSGWPTKAFTALIPRPCGRATSDSTAANSFRPAPR